MPQQRSPSPQHPGAEQLGAEQPGAQQPGAEHPGAEQPGAEQAGATPGSGATITPYRDGPLIVRGEFRLLDQDGNEIDPGRATVALCRCGKSAIKPFCDGSHKRAGFAAPSAPSRPRPAAGIRREAREERSHSDPREERRPELPR